MGEARLGLCPSECLIKEVVEGEGRKPLFSTDDFRDFHQVVVHDVRQVVCRKFVSSFPEHLVVECRCVYLHMSTDKVVHLHDPVFRHLEADGPVCTGLQKLLPFLFRHRKRVAEAHSGGLTVDECLSCRFHFSTFCSKLFGSIECIICEAVSDELFCILAVYRLSLALPVWCMWMALRCGFHYIAFGIHSFVRNDSAPSECFDYILLRSRYESLRVSVFDSDYEVSSVLLGKEVVIEGCSYSSHMERASR